MRGTEMSTVNFGKIPAALQAKPHWLLWKNIVSHECPRGRKLPLNVNNLNIGSSTDSSSWGTFEDARLVCESLKGFSGIGFVLTGESNIFCVDVDGCIEKGNLSEVARDVLSIFSNKTYVELSFHRDGIHIFGYGHLPDDEKGGMRDGGIEIYDSGRYVATTGFKMKSANPDLTNCQNELHELLTRYPKPKKEPCIKPRTTANHSRGESLTDRLRLSCVDIGFPANAHKTAHGWQGGHPFHDSKTGSNYCINEQSNTWYCFRHQTGGGALELYAVAKGIISCEESGRDCLRDHWGDVFEALGGDGYNLDGTEYEILKKRKELRKKLIEMGVL